MLAKEMGGGSVVQAERAGCLQTPEWEEGWHLRDPESKVAGLECSEMRGSGRWFKMRFEWQEKASSRFLGDKLPKGCIFHWFP